MNAVLRSIIRAVEPWVGPSLGAVSILFLFGPVISFGLRVPGTQLSQPWDVTLSDPLQCKESCNWFPLDHLDRRSMLEHYRGLLGFRMQVPSSAIPSVGQLALFLGPVGDVDETYWNTHLIGKTGTFFPGGRFAHHRNRTYDVPPNWILQEPTQHVLLRIQKIAGPGVGPYRFDPHLGNSEALHAFAMVRDFIGTTGVWVGAIILFVLGIYHFALFQKLRERRDYFHFGMCLISAGVYGTCASFAPYEFTSEPGSLFRFHAISGYLAIAFLIAFFHEHFSVSSSITKWINVVVTVLFVLTSSVITNFDHGLYVVQSWYVYLASFCVWAPWVLWKSRNLPKARAHTVLRVGFLLFSCTLIHDMLVTLGIFRGDLVSIYGMFAFLGGIAVTLAHEFALAYSHVEEQVSARTLELATANEQLRSLEQMKARFFANISHDLKTPIALAFANIEEAKRRAAVTSRHVLDAAEKALNKLQGMVLDILDLIKAEFGTLTLKWEAVSVVEIVKAWAMPYEMLCKKQGLRLQYAVSVDPLLKVPMDVAKMERVFGNLMLNALKFTKEGGITVGLRHDEARLYLEVTDTGPGVPEEERKKIFDRYYQGFNTSLRDHGGSGIGLSYVKEVVNTHNGNVWVEPARLDVGSRFIVALPLSQDVEITGEHFVTDSDIRVAPIKGSLDVPYPHSEPSKYRPEYPSILLVEDNPEVAQVVVNALETKYNIYFAKDGVDALDHLAKRNIHCIVSDIMMPRMDGKEFLKEVKKNERWRPVPFVCLTSLSETNDMIECLNLGANNYVTKPFHQEVLRSTVATLIQNSVFREQLTAKDKMTSLGLLAAGLAHEIRNPVNSAMNLLEGLRREFDQLKSIGPIESVQAQKTLRSIVEDSELLAESFQSARNSVLRIHEITEAIGSYSTGSTELREINLTAAVQRALTILEGKRKESGVTIDFLHDRPVSVQGFPSIHQAVMNVIDNAIDAVSSRLGRVGVSITDSDDNAMIEVHDDGPGIPLEHQPHLFDAFFTSKARGTGLGLYITRAIVEYQHLGSITFHSQEGQGATFRIALKKVPDIRHRDMLNFKGFPVPV